MLEMVWCVDNLGGQGEINGMVDVLPFYGDTQNKLPVQSTDMS